MLNVVHSEEKKAFVNNLEICYDTFGNKDDPAMILIMGLASQMIVWPEAFCEALAKAGYYVIRFDNRDIGLSSKLDDKPVPNALQLMQDLQMGKHPEVPYKLSDMAKDTVGLLDFLDIKAANIVGVSMGGMIAQTVAIEYPDRVKTLTSISSTTGNPRLPQATPEASKILVTPPSPDREKNIENSIKVWRLLNGSTYSFDQNFIRERSARAFDRNFDSDGSARQLAAILGSGSRNKYLKDLKVKTLVIHGDADPLIPVEAGKDTAESIAGSKLVIIKGMGHTIPEEVAPQIISEILNHVK